MLDAIEAFAWSDTSLGAPEAWPASLRMMVGVALRTKFPMLIFWGAGLIQIYNDAFIPILGKRHPAALGQPASECWYEIWDAIGPLLHGAFADGTPVWGKDRPLRLERNGYPEETFFTFSYSQFGEPDEEGGVLCTCVETTQAVLRERELERGFDREHRASVAFQTAALPQALPSVPGLTFDAIYEAAEKSVTVGGDWYDAFRLSDGRVAVSVGDVVGHGLKAAVTMAAARQAIRGAAQVYPQPRAVLDAADRTLRSEEPDCIVTAFLGVIDPVTRSIAYASAGHPPPLLRRPDGTIGELAGNGLPLGLRDERHEEEAHVTRIEAGSLLVLYTDGLTESTHDVFDGERRLRDALGDPAIESSAAPAARIHGAVLSEAGDDVAILTVAFAATAESIERWNLRAGEVAAATGVRREVVAALVAYGAAANEVADAEVILGELLGNVVRHTEAGAEVALDLSGDYPVLHVLDRGAGFTFHARLPNDVMSETGRGLYITTKLAREVSVTPRGGGGSHARVVLAARLRRTGRPGARRE